MLIGPVENMGLKLGECSRHCWPCLKLGRDQLKQQIEDLGEHGMVGTAHG